MKSVRINHYWTLIIILLIATIVIGSIVAWSKYRPAQPIEIALAKPSNQERLDQIYISGAVVNPGSYPLRPDDSLETLIDAAGGTNDSANPSRLQLFIPTTGDELQPQKVNINQAEAWLLEALPGIGETKAQAIIEYRTQHGPFLNTNELTKVEGISITIYEQIKHLIAVAD